MIVISLNVRGVGGAPKSLALKRLFDLVKPDIVMIQETMVDGNKAREVFSKKKMYGIYVRWIQKVCLGGYCLHGIPKKANFNAFFTPAGILLEGFVKQINKNLKLVNCYGSYADRQSFWNIIKRMGY
jgi:exonuclease III